jgi:hypothetical protein
MLSMANKSWIYFAYCLQIIFQKIVQQFTDTRYTFSEYCLT